MWIKRKQWTSAERKWGKCCQRNLIHVDISFSWIGYFRKLQRIFAIHNEYDIHDKYQEFANFFNEHFHGLINNERWARHFCVLTGTHFWPALKVIFRNGRGRIYHISFYLIYLECIYLTVICCMIFSIFYYWHTYGFSISGKARDKHPICKGISLSII